MQNSEVRRRSPFRKKVLFVPVFDDYSNSNIDERRTIRHGIDVKTHLTPAEVSEEEADGSRGTYLGEGSFHRPNPYNKGRVTDVRQILVIWHI